MQLKLASATPNAAALTALAYGQLSIDADTIRRHKTPEHPTLHILEAAREKAMTPFQFMF